MRRSRPLAAVVIGAVAFVACSSYDDAGDRTPPPAETTLPAGTSAPPSTVETPSPPLDPTSPSSGPSRTAPPTATTAGTATSARTSPSTTSRPPTAAERLARTLPDAADLDIAPGWLERVLSSDLTDVPTDEVDPFNGLLDCRAGPVVPTDAGLWVERKFTGTEPVDDILSVRIVVIVEDDAAATARADRVANCEGSSEEIVVDGPPSGEAPGKAAVTEVFSSASGALPFPAAIAHGVARTEGRTVSVTVLGLNNGVGFAAQARGHLQAALDAI